MKDGRTHSSNRRPRLFISYRRRTDSASARLLKEELTRAGFEVFRDVDDIEAGEAFPETIRAAVEDCDAFLLLVSPGWVELIKELHDPEDFVRREIASALAREVPLIPLLLGDARMPEADELPAEIRDLAFRQALELSDDRWDYDVARLVKNIRARTELSVPRSFLGTRRGRAAVFVAVVAGALLCAAALLPRAVWYGLTRDIKGCVGAYAPDRLGGTGNLRLGSYDSPVVGASDYDEIRRRRNEPGGIPLVLTLWNDEGEFGAVIFRFFKAERVEDGEFRVERIIEPPCADVQEFFNSDRPAGDKHVLKNWDRLVVRLGGRNYLLRLEDNDTYIVATLLPAPADVQTPWR